MPTRSQVLIEIGADRDYERAAERLGIPAGQAYLIATGMPADGSDTFGPGDVDRAAVIEGSTQHLVYQKPEAANPTKKSEVHEWIRRRAQEDAPMIAAARRRDALPGEPEEPEDDTDVCHVLTRQHDQVTALMEQLKAIPGVSKGGSEVHQSRRASIVDLITVALSGHETAEQEYFWPAVRKAWDDGASVVDEALRQEQEGKDGLVALGRLSPSDPEFDETAEKVEKALRRHVAFEDRVLWALEETMAAEDRANIGRKVQRAERHAPTRPHPHAPKRPGAVVKAAAPGAAALDRLRDRAGDRPAERRGRAEEEPPAGLGALPEPGKSPGHQPEPGPPEQADIEPHTQEDKG